MQLAAGYWLLTDSDWKLVNSDWQFLSLKRRNKNNHHIIIILQIIRKVQNLIFPLFKPYSQKNSYKLKPYLPYLKHQ